MGSKFVICSQHRTGSHLLASALDSHPDVKMTGEVFLRPEYIGLPREAEISYNIETFSQPGIPNAWTQMDFLTKTFEQYDGFILHRAFINPWHYVLSSMTEDVRILFLSRKNLLLQFCSFEIMLLPTPEKRTEPIELDLTRLKYQLLEWSYLDEMFREKLVNHHVHEVVYEEMCGDFNRQMEDIQRFLSLPITDLKPSTKKVETRSLSQIITNYGAVRNFLNTYRFPFRWNRFLEESDVCKVDPIGNTAKWS